MVVMFGIYFLGSVQFYRNEYKADTPLLSTVSPRSRSSLLEVLLAVEPHLWNMSAGRQPGTEAEEAASALSAVETITRSSSRQ